LHKVSILKCEGYTVAAVKHVILESFSFFGGVEKFIRSGEKVLLKPNLIASSKTDVATTHAVFVEAAVEIIKEQRATPLVGDSPAFGSTKGVAKSTGILDVLKRQGVDIVEFKKNDVFRGDIRITKSVNDFDKIINLPKLKAHNQFGFTGATKNLFGFTKGKIKAWQHVRARNNLEKFCLMILQIHDLIKPAFTLVDAIDIMENEGPRGGPKRHFGFVFAGINCLSIDTVMAKCLSIDIHQVPLLHVARKNGYTGTATDQIEVKGESVENATMADFGYPKTLSHISFNLRGIFRSVLLHLWLLAVKERR